MSVRFRGLMLMALGVILTALGILVMVGIAWLSHELLGFARVFVVLSALPLVLVLIGWLELLTGIKFSELRKFDTAEPMTKFGLSVLVIAAVILFIPFAVLIIVLGVRIAGPLS